MLSGASTLLGGLQRFGALFSTLRSQTALAAGNTAGVAVPCGRPRCGPVHAFVSKAGRVPRVL